MKPWFARVVTVLFVLSLVATPQFAAMAQEPGATPVIVDEPQSGLDEEQVPEDAGSDDEDQTEDIQKPDSEVTTTGEVGALAITGDFDLAGATYDAATGTATLTINLGPTFAAESGDEIDLGVWSGGSGYIQTLGPLAVSGVTGVSGTSSFSSEMTIVFNDAHVGAGTIEVSWTPTITWYECSVNSAEYTQSMEVGVYRYDMNQTVEFFILGDTVCPGIEEIMFDDVYFDIWDKEIEAWVLVPEGAPAGTTMWFTYPTDVFVVEPGPVDVFMWSGALQTEVKVGTAVASNGTVTITLSELNSELQLDGWLSLDIGATPTATCEPGSAYAIGSSEYTFATSSGEEFSGDIDPVLCNAARLTKTGSWQSDENGPYILWEIDTGDLFGHDWAYFSDWLETDNHVLDCTSIVFTPINPGTQWASDSGPYCETSGDPTQATGFNGSLTGADIVRAHITIISRPVGNMDGNPYVNCADTYASSDVQPQAIAADVGTGRGDTECFELFPPEAGDFITKTVDKATATSGETVTYTVTVETTSSYWESIQLTEMLPAGFTLDPASITCSVTPAMHQSDPCFLLAGDKIFVTARAVEIEGEEFSELVANPATITLAFSGIVSGAPDTVITNQACSVRDEYSRQLEMDVLSMGDPTIPGGGEICAVASTTILPDPTPVTPTPSPTASPSPTPTIPATPGATPTAPVSPDPTATATSAVTGLPETGNGGGSAQGVSLLLGALAASVLVAGAFGMRSRMDGRQ